MKIKEIAFVCCAVSDMHLKSTTLIAAVTHLRDQDIAFFLGPVETKVCHWVAFRDPDGNRLVIHKRK
jgi:hypothetical protein